MFFWFRVFYDWSISSFSFFFVFFLMIRRPPRSTQGVSSAASDVYKRQVSTQSTWVKKQLVFYMVVDLNSLEFKFQEQLQQLFGLQQQQRFYLRLLRLLQDQELQEKKKLEALILKNMDLKAVMLIFKVLILTYNNHSIQILKGDLNMADKMTKIEIITRKTNFEELKNALNEIGVMGMTVTQVLGCGTQKGDVQYYRGVPMELKLSLIHISEPTRPLYISYAVFCLKKKKKINIKQTIHNQSDINTENLSNQHAVAYVKI
eukprot:TRINITY_DN3902_c0_g1_i2.p1 TRINITY_DN3902_c0_g1~~TRINITY_DN3902_c0_g1_i2.p1  ORF type:complete len:261 (-),score=30.25 TRINITY_DN3902_c0_g1_i2:36-818(-)